MSNSRGRPWFSIVFFTKSPVMMMVGDEVVILFGGTFKNFGEQSYLTVET